MKRPKTTTRIFTFHAYQDDQLYLSKLMEGNRQTSETLRELINHGAFLFKNKPKRYRTITRSNRPLGERVSVTLYDKDAQYLTSLTTPEVKLADILREMLSISVEAKKARAGVKAVSLEERLTALEDSLKAVTEVLLVLTNRTIYGLEISNTILPELVADPTKVKSLYAQIRKQATANVGEILTKLSQQQENPEWFLANLADKIQKTKGNSNVN